MPKHTFTYRVTTSRDVKYVVNADNELDAQRFAESMLYREHKGEEYSKAQFTLTDTEVEETLTIPFPSNIKANG